MASSVIASFAFFSVARNKELPFNPLYLSIVSGLDDPSSKGGEPVPLLAKEGLGEVENV